MIILKVTKNQGFTLSLEDILFEKPRDERDGGAGGGQIDPPAVLGLKYIKNASTPKNNFLTGKFSNGHI